MDFCVDEKIMNFIEPPPDKLAAMEEVRRDRFNVRQLRNLVDELQELAKHNYDGRGGIQNKVVVDLLLRKLEISKALWDDGCLPEEWWGLGEYDFQNIVRNLDRSGTGSVNWKQLATFIILLKSPLPSEDELETYKKAFAFRAGKDLILDEEKFTQVINREIKLNTYRSLLGSTPQNTHKTVTTRQSFPVSNISRSCCLGFIGSMSCLIRKTSASLSKTSLRQ